MFDLSGKSALVTGASGGIGGAIAHHLHGAGAAVGLSGIRVDALEALAAEPSGCVWLPHVAFHPSARASRTSLFSRSRSSLTCLRDSRSFLLWSFLLCSSSPLSALVLRRSSCFARFFTR